MKEVIKILLIEDQIELWDTIKELFNQFPYTLMTANSRESALFHLKNTSFDLVLLDLILGDDDGTDILKFIRRQNTLIPVIILSSLSNLATREVCFSLGADDYLVKPYVPEELLMRAKRAIERKKLHKETTSMIERLEAGEISLDMENQQVWIHSKPVKLRKKLYHMLLLFMQNPNCVIRKEHFHSLLWRNELYDENSLNVHIHQLRKIMKEVENPKIITISKTGYRLKVDL